MKKIIFLIFLLFMPFMVNAEVKISDAELVDNTEGLEVEKNPHYEGLQLDIDMKLATVGDFAKYKLTIENDGKKDYEIDMGEAFSDKEYIKYEFSYVNDDSAVLKANASKDIYVTVSYNKEVPDTEFVNGKYQDNNQMAINLSNNEQQQNPETKTGYAILATAILLFVSLLLILLNKYKLEHLMVLVIAIAVALPISIFALEKITIKISAKIEIVAPERYMAVRSFGCSGYLNEGLVQYIKYKAGMTWEEFINSNYYTSLNGKSREALTNELIPADENDIENVKNNIRKIDERGLMTYPAGFLRCTEKVPYAYYYSSNVTPEQQAAEDAYVSNFHACEQEYNVDGYYGSNFTEGPHKSKVIKPQTEVVYRFAHVC